MAKISALTDGDPAVGTDVVPVARSSTNRKLTLAMVKTLVNTSPTFTGTVTGGVKTVASWGVPVILASSGSMANNGAVSGMTALPATYSNGAWLYLPAEAIQAGSAAGFYWFVASSTTAGTVYNSTFDGLSVPAAGTATPFVSTGPGAFTGIATGEITAATMSIAANTLGASGRLLYDIQINNNTAAGNKILRLKFGATTHATHTLTTTQFLLIRGVVGNTGLTGAQMSRNEIVSGGGLSMTSTYNGSVDTTAAVSLVLTLEKATATNHVIYEGGHITVVRAS